MSLTPQFNGTGYPIEDQVEFLEEGDALKVEVTLNNDTWVLKTDSGSGDIYMDVALKRLLVLGLSSDLAECTGWNAAVRADPDAVRVQAFNERKLTMTLPRLAGYDIRVPETVTLVVPGATVASDEDIDASPGGEANAFVLRPDTPAADRLEVGWRPPAAYLCRADERRLLEVEQRTRGIVDALTTQRHEGARLADGRRKGFFIGDGAGIGNHEFKDRKSVV